MADYVPPKVNADAFNCPHCSSYSDQFWKPLEKTMNVFTKKEVGFMVGNCRRCDKITIWKSDKMIYPSTGNAPPPNSDMPEEIKNDYNEARDVASRSPRSACVLLRLCVEKICNEKIPMGTDLNEKIGKLVKQGLDKKIVNSLDSVRVIGGQAAHPLEMNLKDDTQTATALFSIVNYISDWVYTREKNIDQIFDILPENKKTLLKKGIPGDLC